MKGFLNMRSRISPFFMHVLYCLPEQPIRNSSIPIFKNRLWITIAFPKSKTSEWRCGPVDNPVFPTVPITLFWSSLSCRWTTTVSMCAYRVQTLGTCSISTDKPYPVSCSWTTTTFPGATANTGDFMGSAMSIPWCERNSARTGWIRSQTPKTPAPVPANWS